MIFWSQPTKFYQWLFSNPFFMSMHDIQSYSNLSLIFVQILMLEPSVTDKHLQRLLLWLFLSKPALQTNDVDGSLDFLVIDCCFSWLQLQFILVFVYSFHLGFWMEMAADEVFCYLSACNFICLCYCRYTAFGSPVPHRPAEDLAFAVARFIQKGGSFVNYYMVSSLSMPS